MSSDAAGGAILAWDDGTIYAQRIDGMGSTMWAANGVTLPVAVCEAGGSRSPVVSVATPKQPRLV